VCNAKYKVMRIEPEIIIEKISEYYCQSKEQISAKTRKGEIIKTRQIIMTFLREYTTLTYLQISTYFSQQHAMAIYSIRHVKDIYDTNRQFRNEIEEIRSILLKSQEKNNLSLYYNLMELSGKQLNLIS
jgi:chromosomal replication initiation ATPase DnaA